MNRINIQDQFLNQVRKEKIRVAIELLSGTCLEGMRVISFDNFCLLVEGPDREGNPFLIYKHAIAWLKPVGGGNRFRFFSTPSGSEGFRNPPRFSERRSEGDPSQGP